MQKPILVLQMQRMGDLILSFPLLGILQNIYTGHPLWTVAEEQFFSQLMPMAPHTVFFPPTAASKLQYQQYRAVINLSHRPDAALLAGQVNAEERYGAYTQNGTTFIGGDWALYRASIVQNNRYNRFHWSDLNLLDHLQGKNLPPWNVSTKPEPREQTIGIFVGASEAEKRPSAKFFALLARDLHKLGHTSLFLGGPDDVATGREAESLSGLKGASLCGKFTVEQLALVLQKLSLLITPDTGPMHLAAWVNTPILNLSLGPVNPWETGPRSSRQCDHYVLQAGLSCTGCWQACSNTSRCHEKFIPQTVADVAHTLVQAPNKTHITPPPLCGMRLYRTGHNAHGLYNLHPCTESKQVHSRELLARFWHQWFWARLQKSPCMSLATQEFATLSQLSPELAEKMRMGIIHTGQKLRQELKNTLIRKKCTLSVDFWRQFPQIVHPFSSYTYLYLQNKEYTLSAWEEIIANIENLYNTIQ